MKRITRRALLLTAIAAALYAVGSWPVIFVTAGGGMKAAPNVATQTATPGIKTDSRIYPEPPLPPLPPRGCKITDPVFGTEIMRVTDERDGQNLGTYYSYWPTFNADSTLMLVRNGGGAFLSRFDPAAFALGAKKEIPPIPGVGNPMFEGATWSGSDPDTLFLTANASLYAYHPSSRTYELLADIQALMPGEYIKQPSWSRDGKRVGFTRKRFADSSEPGWAVYDRGTKKIIARGNADLDEVTISQSGKYLLVKLGAQGAGVVNAKVVNLEAGTEVPLLDDADASPGHGDAGWDSYVGYDNFGNRVTWVDLSSPKKFKPLFQFTAWGHGFGHASLRAADEAWALISFFGTTKPGLFGNEVVLLATDGSRRVRRLFHHRSVYKNYYDSPRANLSLDGRFVAFTSNWGGRARTDLFVARVKTGAPSSPAATPTPTPSSRPTTDERPRECPPS